MFYLNKTKINSIVFLLLFISPHIVYCIIPASVVPYYYIFLPICYLILFFIFFNFYLEKEFTKPLLFSFSFLIFGISNLIVHDATAFFNLLAPVVALLGYIFVFKKKSI